MTPPLTTSKAPLSLAAGETHAYLVTVPAGRLLHIVADQQGIDIVLALKRSGGEALLEIDSPNRNRGTEELWWIAPEDGARRVEVRPWSPAPEGRYRLAEVAVRPPSPDDRLRADACQAVARAQRLRAAGDPVAARRELAAAREIWRRTGEPLQEALVELRLAEVATAAGETGDGESSYRAALALFRRLGEGRQEVFALLKMGEARRLAGNLDGAWRVHAEALRLAQLRGLDDDEAAALNNQALILEARGELRAVLPKYRRALAIFRKINDRHQAAQVLENLGVASSLLGLFDEAEKALTESLALRRELGDVYGEGEVLTGLGWIYRLRALAGGGDEARERARTLLESALARRRAAGDVAGEAGTLDRLGTVHREAGRWREALSCYQNALRLLSRRPPGRDRAHTLNNIAEVWLNRGHPDIAHRFASQSLALFTALEAPDLHGEAHVHFLLGRSAAALGDSKVARRELGKTLDIVEDLRSGLGDQTLTLPFFALRQLYFDGAIEALMRLDALKPGGGFAMLALEVSEKARMRTLLDSLAERRDKDRNRLDRREVRPLTAGRIQGLLDEETVLVEISLGEKQGFLWAVDRHGLRAYPLPGRGFFEPLVRDVYKGFSRRNGDRAAARRLSGMILGPAVDQLRAARRLVIVTDGLLAYVPFGALPWGPEGRPLLEHCEIVRLPSATTLAALRRRTPTGPAGKNTVAVLADPVFSSWDRRVHRSGVSPKVQEPADRKELTRSVRDLGLDGLLRLPATRREAEAIAALAPGSFVALDFSAGREALDSPAVRNARLLHLATHGLLHPEDPALSGIVLSLVDEQGRPREGFLRAEEIAGLDLSADLVVVSACKTALGPEVRGEGLLGLGRAFLRAGARRVLVSLWQIEDNSSAALMKRFYEGFLREGLPPAAALRRAQLSLRDEPGWADPFYWAGFEIQGDWR